MQIGEFMKKPVTLAGAVTIALNAAIFGLGFWDREKAIVEGDTRAITAIESQLIAQQRQIDELKTLSADLRKEFLTEGARANNIAIQRLNDRFNALNEKIESLPIGLDGGVNKRAIEEAVQAAENRLTQRFSVQIGGLVDGAVEKAVENHVASVPAVTGASDVPIATVRKIHTIEEGCVYLPSFGQRFSIQFDGKTEICMKPSQLFANFEVKSSYNALGWEIIGGGASSCPKDRTCFFGDEEKYGFRYRVMHENSFEKNGILYRVYNFEKLG